LAHYTTGISHFTGYLGNYEDPLSGNPFFSQFPPLMQDEFLYHCLGSQGLFLFFERSVVQKIGYFNTNWRGKYGYEHADYSMRAGRIESRCPELYPILKHCNFYFKCQGIGNNYWDDPKENAKQYAERRQDAYTGIGLRIMKP